MKWIAMEQAMQEPAGIAIKDSFAAKFAAETAQAEHICNIASAHILGHMTAQLQVTDTLHELLSTSSSMSWML